MVLALDCSPELLEYRASASVHIGPQLRAARERAGLKQSEVARRMRLDPAIISRWECEEATRYRPVPGDRLPALAEALETTVEELLESSPETWPRHPARVPGPARHQPGRDRRAAAPSTALPSVSSAPLLHLVPGAERCELADDTCPCRFWREPVTAARERPLSAWTFDMPFLPRPQLCCLGCRRHFYVGPGYGPHRCSAGGS